MSPGPSSEDRVVRPALEAALAVAEAGMNEDLSDDRREAFRRCWGFTSGRAPP